MTTLNNLNEAILLYKLENYSKYELWYVNKVRFFGGGVMIVFTLLAYAILYCISKVMLEGYNICIMTM